MIYLDYNSTHPPFRGIMETNLSRYFEEFGNPSGISHFSQKASGEIEKSREKLINLLNSHSSEALDIDGMHFVATGTEAVYQMVFSFSGKPSAILSPYEHECMYAACEDAGQKIVLLKSDETGRVSPESLKSAIETAGRANVSFVSCITASNETGVIQPVAELSAICRENEIPFITDAIQAAGKMQFDPGLFDAFAMNGHKFGAGLGCACVFFKSSERIKSIFRGGLQENENRAGTENLFAILNFIDAYEFQLKSLDHKNTMLLDFRKDIEHMLLSRCGAVIAGEKSLRLANTTFAVFPEMENMDFLLIGLDQSSIAVSTGSSCKSRTRQPSQVLKRMGFSTEESLRALRITTGIFTSRGQIDEFCGLFPEIYSRAL